MKKLTFLALIAIVFASCTETTDKTYFVIYKITRINRKVEKYQYWDTHENNYYSIIDSINKWNIGDTIKFK